jgi:hypothetical protein
VVERADRSSLARGGRINRREAASRAGDRDGGERGHAENSDSRQTFDASIKALIARHRTEALAGFLALRV